MKYLSDLQGEQGEQNPSVLNVHGFCESAARHSKSPNSSFFLGIDTSCDDTCAAIIRDHLVLSNVISSQIPLHQPYGGVFPTVAKLAHQQNIDHVVQLALKRAGLTPHNLDAVAVTVGPGLAPALEIGIHYAETFAATYHLPLIGANHLEGHLLSSLLQPLPRTTPSTPRTPNAVPRTTNQYVQALGLVISGGHTLFLKLHQIGSYQILGQTLDDAAGECLDKIGRMLNLGYPAAPIIEQLAKQGDPTRFPFPLPLTTRHDFDLSFSGLKTHSRGLLTKLTAQKSTSPAPLDRQTLADFCASAQTGVFRHLLYKFEKLLAAQPPDSSNNLILAGGGVTANTYFRRQLRPLAAKYHYTIKFPYSKRLCGDNAAMIAFAGSFHQPTPATLDRQPNLSLT